MVATERGNFTGLYPPVFYWVTGLFVGDDLDSSVIMMRLFNALLFLGLAAAVFAASATRLRRAMIGAMLVTAVPLGNFLVSSINPSSWAMLSAGTLLVSVLGYLTAEARRRRLTLGALAVASLLIGAGARADAAIYAVVAIGAAIIFTVRFDQAYLRRLVLPAILVLAAGVAFLSTGQSDAADAGAAGQSLSLNRLVGIILAVPGLWTGALGQWGLGWLDTGMRPLVWVGSWSVFAAVLFVAAAHAGRRRMLAITLVGLAAFLIPAYMQYLTGQPVGYQIQPRYLLPLLMILVVVAMVRMDGAPFALTKGQRWFVVGVLSAANAVALHDNIRRYVTGNDVGSYNLNRSVEWWWDTALSPMLTWAIGAAAFAAGIAVLSRELTSHPAAGDDQVASGEVVAAPSFAVPGSRAPQPVDEPALIELEPSSGRHHRLS